MKKFYQSRKEFVPMDISELDEITVITKLRDYLNGKSYIVMFDDVWNKHFWGHIKNALPDENGKSGRIVITTRLVDVANSCKISSSLVHIHHLQLLSPKTAWKLFCNKVFQSEPKGHCPTHLDKLSHELVEKCQGLPLAIVAIAGLLSTKNNTTSEWRKLLTSLSSELERTSIKEILSLSYSDLPYHLKSCFLYFGIFPEDYSVRYGRLIRQWIAEGFVNSTKDKSLEDVAEEYLVELINRSLVQVFEVDFDGKAKCYRIHDLLREIILDKMEDISFCHVLPGSNFQGITRRMSIVNSSHYVITGHTPEISHGEILNPLLRTVITNFKLLKILDFEDAPNLDHLPEGIGSLYHLKYLSVRGTRVGLLPKSIENLENLETLDLKESFVFELPVGIKRLCKLRHLLAYHSNEKEVYHINSQKGFKVFNRGIGWLKAMQKLYFIEANVVGVDIFEELSNLTELRKLGMKKLRSADGRKLCNCLQKMNQLESLDVASVSEDEMLDLESISSPPQNLQRLYLKGLLRKLPEWITRLEYLVRIRIYWSKLEDDPLKALKNLPSLLELGINWDGYYGEKLQFEEGAFPKLKVLRLWNLSRLCLLVMEDGTLCNLEEFDIGPTPQLKEVTGFQHLRNIKEVYFDEMPTNFLMLQNFQSLQCSRANICFSYIIDGERWRYGLEEVTKLQENMRGQ
ncbi:NB-ARC domain, LRR domain containing protein [Parasponia andersonii]|uniref:NB-ARC domain, LRR domain containing protein n=1 Tax=Parasponia andersonii TaxID=3476 RepID=A0A2P5ALA8_PARAD|nr:NB-ARC domain, LRR domain containing protein [Parasponia andersonii]